MSGDKPIPDDVTETAISVAREYNRDWVNGVDIIARALMAERERAAKTIHFAPAHGISLEEMRANIPADLRKLGDAVLVWVNEGDFWMSAPTDVERATAIRNGG